MTVLRAGPAVVPHNSASGVTPAAHRHTQTAPGRRLAASQTDSSQSADLKELSQILSTGFEAIRGRFGAVFQELKVLRQHAEEMQRTTHQTFDQLSDDIRDVQQQAAANGSVSGADNKDRIASRLTPRFGAAAVRGATLRSGTSIIQLFEQPIVSCGLTVDMAAEHFMNGVCKDQLLPRNALATMVLSIRHQILRMEENSAAAAPCMQPALLALDDVVAASMSSSSTLHSLTEVAKQGVAMTRLAMSKEAILRKQTKPTAEATPHGACQNCDYRGILEDCQEVDAIVLFLEGFSAYQVTNTVPSETRELLLSGTAQHKSCATRLLTAGGLGEAHYDGIGTSCISSDTVTHSLFEYMVSYSSGAEDGCNQLQLRANMLTKAWQLIAGDGSCGLPTKQVVQCFLVCRARAGVPATVPAPTTSGDVVMNVMFV